MVIEYFFLCFSIYAIWLDTRGEPEIGDKNRASRGEPD